MQRGSARSRLVVAGGWVGKTCLAAALLVGCSATSVEGVGSELGSTRAPVIQSDPPVVIRRLYGGGGNSGATYTNDFVELFNRSSAPVSLANLSVQYTSATAGGLLGGAGLITLLPAFTLQPGQAFLVQEAAGTGGTTPLPTPDATGSIPMSATAGKIALVNSTTSLGCNTDTGSTMGTPCSDAQTGLIIDLVGYGNANYFEGSGPAPTLSNTTGALRAGNGCVDTNNNAADFSAVAPDPHNGASPLSPCTPTDAGSDADAADAGSDVDAADAVFGQCSDPATPIGVIQGTTDVSALVGQTVVIEAAVVGDFQDVPLNGFFLEQPDGTRDTDPNTSEGIFVFEGASSVQVTAGSRARVRGTVAEVNNLTELTSVTDVVVCPGSVQVTADTLTFPVAAVADLERYEGMLVTIAQPLTVTGNFGLGRFGTVDLAVGDTVSDGGSGAGRRLFQPTQIVAPGAAAIALQSLNNRSRIILDDLSNTQNPNPIPYKDVNNSRRVGDTLTSLSGILDGSFPADGTYRIRPTTSVIFASANPRPLASPNVGGRLHVAAANVLNFFTTLDAAGGQCGPQDDLDCRGANTTAEFDRQRTKLLNELESINADVVGLMEVENNASAAVQSLVDGLNTRLGTGSYSFIDTGTIGTDAIKVALIYKPAKVSPVGPFAVLTSAFDARFIDTKNRPALTQTFAEVTTGERFTVVVNHLKSKGSACTDLSPPDPDTGDGQGNCNQTRTKAAQALLAWIASDPTQSHDPDFLLIGDFNAYAKEDPITALEAGGLEGLLDRLGPAGAYSFQFQDQSGFLDHALATAGLAGQVTGVAEWHNNADEPVVLDYNQEFKTDDPFNPNDPFRSSDHDPVIVGLNLGPAPVPGMSGGQTATLAAFLLFLGLGVTLPQRRPRLAPSPRR